MRVKEKSGKAGMKLNIQKTKMAYRCGKRRSSGRFYFPGLQNHYGWWLQPWNSTMLALWKENYDKLRVLKSIDITLPIKVRIDKPTVFPVVMYTCKSWIIKKIESWKIDAFKLWCWRKLLRVPWTVRRSKQQPKRKSTLNIHWKDWGWSWSSHNLATWYK